MGFEPARGHANQKIMVNLYCVLLSVNKHIIEVFLLAAFSAALSKATASNTTLLLLLEIREDNNYVESIAGVISIAHV